MKNGDNQAQTEANRTVDVESSSDLGIQNVLVYEKRKHSTDCAGAIRLFDETCESCGFELRMLFEDR